MMSQLSPCLRVINILRQSYFLYIICSEISAHTTDTRPLSCNPPTMTNSFSFVFTNHKPGPTEWLIRKLVCHHTAAKQYQTHHGAQRVPTGGTGVRTIRHFRQCFMTGDILPPSGSEVNNNTFVISIHPSIHPHPSITASFTTTSTLRLLLLHPSGLLLQ